MPPNLETAPSSESLVLEGAGGGTGGKGRIRCAVLGCGMMGQEHVSYLLGYPQLVRLDFLCDPHAPSLAQSLRVVERFAAKAAAAQAAGGNGGNGSAAPPEAAPPDAPPLPQLLRGEAELLARAAEIDLLVIASPNHLHTPQLERWAGFAHLTILCEKPVAVSAAQLDRLRALQRRQARARIWVAMEYRFIPAVSRLLGLLPDVGEIQMVTIRENRYPFLHKVGAWNRDRQKTGDTLVEKCCHFFDLFRLITGQEASLEHVRALAQRGLNYGTEPNQYAVPILDAAYVTLPFLPRSDGGTSDSGGDSIGPGTTGDRHRPAVPTLGCLELCMYAEGSRHQEEIIVTGTAGRLEAYLPENRVYQYRRPAPEEWPDRSVPPPAGARHETIHDCSDVRRVHGIDRAIPTHGGYHYSSTAVEWLRLLEAVEAFRGTGTWAPLVSLEDGIRAVEIGLRATQVIVNERPDGSSALKPGAAAAG